MVTHLSPSWADHFMIGLPHAGAPATLHLLLLLRISVPKGCITYLSAVHMLILLCLQAC